MATQVKVKSRVPDDIRKNLAPYSDILSHLLYHRGITVADEADRFLNPNYDRDTHDPFILAGMNTAVERIFKAIREEQKVVIYSDYDTDGIPAGVALHDFFVKTGFKSFTNYIPHRHDEGFGLNRGAIEEFAKGKVDLLITIDCGIADVELVTLAQSLGIDVIVTDHHLPGEILPPAHAVVNPKRADCMYPEKMLCGAGVVYKLIQALIIREQDMREGLTTDGKSITVFKNEVKVGWEKWLLDMIGIATLSDMVPLRGENRVFARYGLFVLRKSPRLGLMRLLSKLKINQKHLTETDIGFMIGPRINAASRMGVPMDAFRLLATTDEVEADMAADHLNKINDERKGVVAHLVKEVKHVMKERYRNEPKGVVVIGNPEWKPSLLGLAANSCAEEYGLPVFLWGRDGDGVIKGSCRTGSKDSNLVTIMKSAPAGTFIQYGGHAQSGGFSVSSDAVHFLEERLNKFFDESQIGGANGTHGTSAELVVDAELSVDDVNWTLYDTIEKIGPFGEGNAQPTFVFRNVSPVEVKDFGKTKNHLEIVFKGVNRGNHVPAIGFFMTSGSVEVEMGRELLVGRPITLIASLEKSMFRGRPELRLRIVDIL